MPIVYHDATYTRAYPAIIAAAIATTWSLMVFCVRVYLRLSTKRSFGPDDVACAVGMVLAKATRPPALGSSCMLTVAPNDLALWRRQYIRHANFRPQRTWPTSGCAQFESVASFYAGKHSYQKTCHRMRFALVTKLQTFTRVC